MGIFPGYCEPVDSSSNNYGGIFMFNVSDYVIAQKLDEGAMLVYSTLTTSIVTLESEIYEDIFEKHKFSDYEEICT